MFGFLGFLAVVEYVSWSLVNMYIAQQKNRNMVSVAVISVLLTPILGYLYVAAVPTLPKRTRAQSGEVAMPPEKWTKAGKE